MMRHALPCFVFVLALGTGLSSLAQRPGEILIGDYSFDPANGIPQVITRGVPYQQPRPGAEHWRIIQLHRVPDVATQAVLKDRFGLELRRFVQGGAYIERVTPETARDLEAAGFARASVPYHPALKYSRLIGQAQYVTEERRAIQGLLLRAVLFERADLRQTEESIAAVAGTADIRVFDDRRYGGTGQIVFRLASANQLPALALIEGIAGIEEVGEIIEDNGGAATVLQSGTPGNASIWQAGLTGTGQLVHVLEGKPPDFNHCFFSDPQGYPVGPNHRKVDRNQHVPSALPSAHATFIDGSVLGDPLNVSAQPFRGGAWSARLIAGDNGKTSMKPILDELGEAEDHGAYIHTNSWHESPASPPKHTTTNHVNQFMWEHEDNLVIGAISNMNGEHGPPGTAKNALGVSAAQKDGMTYGEGLPGPYVPMPLSDPTRKQRKPDLVGVGCGIVSAKKDTANPPNQCKTDVFDTDEDAFCSTSDATAHAAAAATLVRQYYTDGWYPSGAPTVAHQRTPSGALVKATLLNSTRDMTGPSGYPSNLEGWGIITLKRALLVPGGAQTVDVREVRNGATDALVQGGGPHQYTFSIPSAESLKVTLAWTDHHSSALLVNNLDLEVMNPVGQTFRGNDFVGGVSALGGAPDSENTVEQVLIPTPTPGSWIVRIKATTIGAEQQGYALVVTTQPVPPAPPVLVVRPGPPVLEAVDP